LDTALSVAIGAGTLAILLATLDTPAMTWDEGYTLQREEKMRAWFSLVGQGDANRQAFGRETLAQFWPFAREEPNGHPPFYAVLGNVGWSIGRGWLSPLAAHRLGPALLFGFTMAAMVAFVAARFGRLAGVAAAGSWFAMPRVFAHAHLASYDIPLACLWLLCVATFWNARASWAGSPSRAAAWSVAFALMLALAAATKFTGWLIPIPLLAWSLLDTVARPDATRAAALARWGAVALVAGAWMVPAASVASGVRQLAAQDRAAATQPSSGERPDLRTTRAAQVANWFRGRAGDDPSRWWMFLPLAVLGCTRHRALRTRLPWLDLSAPTAPWAIAAAVTPLLVVASIPPWWHAPWRSMAIFLWSNLSRAQSIPIATMFFGRVYDFSLPWYNTLVWTAITAPAAVLLLAMVGLAAAVVVRQERPWLILVVMNWATLMIVRALPGTPGHDGERQLLGSFPFLACLAGVGVYAIELWCSRRWRPATARGVAAVVCATALASGAWTVWAYHPCQLSFYSAAVGGLRGAATRGFEPTYYWDALTPDVLAWLNENSHGDEGVAFSSYPLSLDYLRRWGHLHPPIRPVQPGPARWYVLQNRSGSLRPSDLYLMGHAAPAFTKELHGVPLLWVFDYGDYEKALRDTTFGDGSIGGVRGNAP
jgi:hypothetical protein